MVSQIQLILSSVICAITFGLRMFFSYAVRYGEFIHNNSGMFWYSLYSTISEPLLYFTLGFSIAHFVQIKTFPELNRSGRIKYTINAFVAGVVIFIFVSAPYLGLFDHTIMIIASAMLPLAAIPGALFSVGIYKGSGKAQESRKDSWDY